MKLQTCLFAFFLLAKLAAQNEFAASKIPPELLKNADRIVRRHELKFQILSRGEALETERKVITLLDERAENELQQVFVYDRFSKIEDISATVFEADGSVFRDLKKKDIADQKLARHLFVDDVRLKIVRFPRRPFPFTIEIQVVKRTRNTMFYPVFMPQTAAKTAVEQAEFEILAPPNFSKTRIWTENTTAENQLGPLHFRFENLPAFPDEPNVPEDGFPLPKVVAAPTDFEIDGRAGSMATWADFGLFMQKLNASQTVLPKDFEAELRAMTSDCQTDSCRIERIYGLLQAKTRYFFVGLGIGGWQPALAADVHEHKYGDCKGLSNYAISMLRAVGVDAKYVLIRAGVDEQKSQIPSFPNAFFNHATVCVPTKNDTIWLECTSQTEAAGFVGTFTDDRSALLISENGAAMVRTPRYSEAENTIKRTVEIDLKTDGSAAIKMSSKKRGLAQTHSSYLAEQPHEMQLNAIYKNLEMSDFEIKSYEIETRRGRIPQTFERLELTVEQLASASGKRLFLPVSMFFKPPILAAETSEPRRFPIQAVSRGLTEENEIAIRLPDGFFLESEARDVRIESAFGSFERTVKTMENGSIRIFQKRILNATVQPATAWPAFLDFEKNVAKAMTGKLVLVKNT